MTIWHFYNSNSGETVEIQPESVESYMRNISAEDMPFMFAWSEGMSDWTGLIGIAALMSIRNQKPPPPPRPPRGARIITDEAVASIHTNDMTSTEAHLPNSEIKSQPELVVQALPAANDVVSAAKEEVALQNNATNPDATQHASALPVHVPSEKRLFPRLEGKLRVVVISGETSFRTFTVDVSRGGLRLAQPVPYSMLGKEIDLYIASPDLKTNLKMRATLIADQREPLRLAFTYRNQDVELRLLAWIETLSKLKTAAS